jgi:hypothetical protein
MSDDRPRSGPDLRVARRYLEGYVEPGAAQESRPNWLTLHAWPAAILLLVLLSLFLSPVPLGVQFHP